MIWLARTQVSSPKLWSLIAFIFRAVPSRSSWLPPNRSLWQYITFLQFVAPTSSVRRVPVLMRSHELVDEHLDPNQATNQPPVFLCFMFKSSSACCTGDGVKRSSRLSPTITSSERHHIHSFDVLITSRVILQSSLGTLDHLPGPGPLKLDLSNEES